MFSHYVFDRTAEIMANFIFFFQNVALHRCEGYYSETSVTSLGLQVPSPFAVVVSRRRTRRKGTFIAIAVIFPRSVVDDGGDPPHAHALFTFTSVV